MSSLRISRHINAPRAAVDRALLDAEVVGRWMVAQGGPTSEVHAFEGLLEGRPS